MKKYYISSWCNACAWMLGLSAFEGYLYFGITDSPKVVIFVSWLIGIICILFATVVCNIIKKYHEK